MAAIIFLLVLSALVVFHEFGHFFAAKLFGIKAEEFGVGFPPRAFGFVKVDGKWKRVSRKDRSRYANTVWSINWLPLGGFVRIKGEQEDGIHDTDSLLSKPIWQRCIVIAAGVLMNWLLAIILFTIVFSVGTLAVLEDVPPGGTVSDRSVFVTSVIPHSAAFDAHVNLGDRIVSVDGTPVTVAVDAQKLIATHGTSTFPLVFEREGKDMTVSLTPRFLTEVNRPALGVALSDVGKVSFPVPQAFFLGIRMTAGVTGAIVQALGGVVVDLFSGRGVASGVSGPVGIAVVTGQVAREGIMPLLQFAAMLSVNLAVINFLPIPALDGGRVLFLAIEKLRRKPMKRSLEIAIHNSAFLILILLILLITARDISIYGGTIVGGVKGMVGK